MALVQAELAWHDIGANIARFDTLLSPLAGKVDLIALPEMFTTGFTMKPSEVAEGMDGHAAAALRRWAKKLNAHVTGSAVIREAGRYYNRLLWARPDGTVEHYDKRHLFRMANEQQHYAAGSRRLIVELKGWRICPMICYDLRFPVWSRNWGDYDVLLYVANWPQRRAHAWSTLLKARAIENLAYVVGVNRIGKDGNGATYAGDSVALDFLGQPLSSEGGGDRVETAVFDFESLRK